MIPICGSQPTLSFPVLETTICVLDDDNGIYIALIHRCSKRFTMQKRT